MGEEVDEVIKTLLTKEAKVDEEHALSCCHTLAQHAAGGEENQQEIFKKDGVMALIAAIEKHEGSPEIMLNACYALTHLTLKDEEIKKAFFVSGGVDAVTNGLKATSSATPGDTQHTACVLIANLSSHDVNCRQDFGDAGVIEAIAESIRAHPKEAKVLESGCSALKNLSASNEENRKKIWDSGAIGAIAKVMQQEKDNLDIQKTGAKFILACSTASKDNHALAVKSGALGAFCTALKKHHKDKDFAKDCRGFIYSISDPEGTKERSKQPADLVAALLSILRLHGSDSPEVSSDCIDGLKQLAGSSSDYQELIPAADGIKPIIKAGTDHVKNGPVQKSVCAAIARLAGKKENQKVIAEVGGIEMALAAINKHKDEMDVQMEAFGALIKLSAKNDAIRTKIAELGGMEAMMTGIYLLMETQVKAAEEKEEKGKEEKVKTEKVKTEKAKAEKGKTDKGKTEKAKAEKSEKVKKNG